MGPDNEIVTRGEGVCSVDISLGPKLGKRKQDIDGMEQTGGLSGIYGDEGVMKTALAVSKAIHQKLGWPWLGHRTTPQVVLYLDWERDETEFRIRVHEVAEGMGLDWPPSIFYRRMWKPLLSSISDIRAEIAARRATTITIDSLSYAGVIDLATTINAANALRSLGVSVFTLDHQAREQRGESYASKDPFGSRFKEGAYNSLWQIENADADPRHPEIVDLIMRDKKFSAGPLRPNIYLRAQFQEGSVAIKRIRSNDISAAVEEKLTKAKRVLLSLRRLGGKASAAEIAENTGLAKKDVQEQLSRAKRRGTITSREGERKSDPHTWEFVSSEVAVEFEEEDDMRQIARPNSGGGGGLAPLRDARRKTPPSSSSDARAQDPLQEGELQDPEAKVCLDCGKPVEGKSRTCGRCAEDYAEHHHCFDCGESYACTCNDPYGLHTCPECQRTFASMARILGTD